MKRIMIAAPNSGSGKTTVVCGLLQAFLNRKLQVRCFKCGPDYIDPMFHRTVLQVPTGNLDAYFTDEDMLSYLLYQEAFVSEAFVSEDFAPDASCHYEEAGKDMDAITVVEGVMGYFDGQSVDSVQGSSYDLARKLQIPTILVVNGRGASRSIVAMIKGFLTYENPCMIKGIILNQVSETIYRGLQKHIEAELQVPVVGYLPLQQDFVLASRHLGLVRPEEVNQIQEQLMQLSCIMEQTIAIDKLLDIAGNVPELEYQVPKSMLSYLEYCKACRKCKECKNSKDSKDSKDGKDSKDNKDGKDSKDNKDNRDTETEPVRIAVARDAAFCFYYEENFMLLRKAGTELVFFSPLDEEHLPEHVQGLLLGGGYPELYGARLGENESMRSSVREALEQGLPCIAECGGYLYLQEYLEDEAGQKYPMVGFLPGTGQRAAKRKRFGYVSVEMKQDSVLGKAGTRIPGHEFHYWESNQEGEAATAYKPDGIRSWSCERIKENTIAGFPHFYFPGNLEVCKSFLEKCRQYDKHRKNSCKKLK